MPASSLPPFEHTVDEAEQNEYRIPLPRRTYQTIFEDHGHGEENIIHPRSIFRMRIKRKEASWSKL